MMNLDRTNLTQIYSPLMDRAQTDKYYEAHVQDTSTTKWNSLSKTVKSMTSRIKNLGERRNSHERPSHIQVCE